MQSVVVLIVETPGQGMLNWKMFSMSERISMCHLNHTTLIIGIVIKSMILISP